jgi:putative tryptophan/tyrosine transport system substrate-binding protein
MRRREFIAGLGSAAAWPLAARAQQTGVPVVGFIESGSPERNANFVAAFRKGLSETGYAEGRNVTIEYRYALGEIDRMPELAVDLVRRGVAVIATPGSTPTSLAAKAATTKIPIVFGVGSDPVQVGLVPNLNRPGGNVTGFSEMNTEVGPKRFALLHMLVPNAEVFGVLVNPKNPLTEFAVREARAAAAKIGRPTEIVPAGPDRDIDSVFTSLAQKRVGALVVTPDTTFNLRGNQVIALAARHSIPAIYWDPLFPRAGGLMSYGSTVEESYRQVGIYVGRILKGEKPADLPVLQPTKFDLVINLKTAKALGLTIPETLLATADEVIQ